MEFLKGSKMSGKARGLKDVSFLKLLSLILITCYRTIEYGKNQHCILLIIFISIPTLFVSNVLSRNILAGCHFSTRLQANAHMQSKCNGDTSIKVKFLFEAFWLKSLIKLTFIFDHNQSFHILQVIPLIYMPSACF